MLPTSGMDRDVRKWRQGIQQSILAARKEERFAEEHSNHHEGIPAIAVVVGGGWSRWTHIIIMLMEGHKQAFAHWGE